MNDREKLVMVAKKYFKKYGMFTSAMLSYYIISEKIKFRKDMNTRRIGKMISDSQLFEKIRKGCLVYYCIGGK